MNKALVVYYSWSGNTRNVAEQIRSVIGCDVFEITPLKPYPKQYNQCTAQAKQEINTGYKPVLSDTLPNLESYNTIFIGTPNWWSTLAPPVMSFLMDSNVEGKTLIPFCTHGSGGTARCFSDMKKYANKSTFLDGFAVAGNVSASASEEIKSWLKRLSLKLNSEKIL